MTQSACISNQKGGCAKTAVATNVAAGVARKGKKTLLLDLDYQGNASSSLGVSDLARRSGKTISNGIFNSVPASDIILETAFPDLYVAAGDMDLHRISTDLALTPGANQFLKEWIHEDKALREFDYIFIDTHPSLCMLFQNAMTFADYYFVPTFPEADSFDGLPLMFRTIETIQKRMNPTLYFLGLVISRMNKNNDTHKKYRKRLLSFARERDIKILGVIPESTAIAAASDRKMPVINYKAHLPVSQAYDELADDLIELLVVRRGRTPSTPKISKNDILNIHDFGLGVESNDIEVKL